MLGIYMNTESKLKLITRPLVGEANALLDAQIESLLQETNSRVVTCLPGRPNTLLPENISANNQSDIKVFMIRVRQNIRESPRTYFRYANLKNNMRVAV